MVWEISDVAAIVRFKSRLLDPPCQFIMVTAFSTASLRLCWMEKGCRFAASIDITMIYHVDHSEIKRGQSQKRLTPLVRKKWFDGTALPL